MNFVIHSILKRLFITVFNLLIYLVFPMLLRFVCLYLTLQTAINKLSRFIFIHDKMYMYALLNVLHD